MELNTNKKTNYRWIVCGFLWVAVAVNYVDRTALSAATPIIMKEFNIDGTEMGIIMAAFFWAYALLQVPMGWTTYSIFNSCCMVVNCSNVHCSM